MLKLGTETGSVINHLMTCGEQIAPEINMGVTICMWSDRHTATILEVKKTKKGVIKEIVIQRDIEKRTDTNGMSESQEYEYTRNPEGRIQTAHLLKSGWRILEWKDDKTGRNNYGSSLVIGVREAYFDYSF